MKLNALFIGLFLLATSAFSQETTPTEKMLLTVFLKHDQTKNLAEIQKIQKDQKFFENFPPAGTKIVTWHVVMGIGQVVTLELMASQLRSVNVALEKTAWKAFSTEFYPTYDLYPIIKDQLKNSEKAK